MNPDLIELYEDLRNRVEKGFATPERVAEYLSSRGLPSYELLESNYAQEQGRQQAAEAPLSTGNRALDAAHNFASMISQAATLGTLDNLVGWASRQAGGSGELAKDIEAHAAQVREEYPRTQLAADLGVGLAMPVGAASNLARGGGLLAKGGAGMLTGGLEGAAAGYGRQAVGEEGIIPVAAGGGIGAAAGGLMGMLASLGGAFRRRTGRGQDAGTRLSARAAELSGEADMTGPLEGRTPLLRNAPFVGGQVAEESLQRAQATNDVRRELAEEVRYVGEQTFGRLQGTPLSSETQGLMDELRKNPITQPFAESLKGRAADQVLPEGARIDWSFDDARMMYRRLRELARLRGLDPASQSDAESMKELADRLQSALDTDTKGLFSPANRAYAQAAEMAEAFDIGLGYRRVGETALDVQSGFDSPAQIEAALNQFSGNPEAQEAFRRGLRYNLFEFGPKTPTSPVIEQALMQRLGDREMLRYMFPEGEAGDEAYRRWLREALEERSADILGQDVSRGLGAAGRAGVTRSLPFGRR